MSEDIARASQPTVLVTGAVQGIGLACCERFEAAGWNVMGWDVKPSDESRWPVEIVDVSDWDAVATAADAVPPLDAVVNCAAIAPLASVLEISKEVWDRTLAINLTGAFHISRFLYQALAQASGTLVHIASVNAKNTTQLRSPYNCSKAGVVALTQALAVEWGLADSGIRVFSVSPGLTLTEQPLARVRSGAIDEERMVGRSPLRRWIQPEEIAGAVFSLVTGEFSALYGANVIVDAGYDAWGGHL